MGDGGKPIAWINASGPAARTGGADARDSLRNVLGHVHADTVDAGRTRISPTRSDIGPDGVLTDSAARETTSETLAAPARHLAAGDPE